MPVTRRDFLRQLSFGVAAIAASRLPAHPRNILRPGGSRKKIIIIGAGLSGLAAGYELLRAGHEVVILEARGRPGGRVHTLREGFSTGLYAEAGASRIPDNHTHTLAYVDEFELPLVPFRPTGTSSVVHVAGRRLTVAGDGNVRWPLALTPEERELGLAGMRERYVYSVIGSAGELAPWPPEKLKQYDRMSWTEFLRSRGASEDAVRLLTLGHNAALVDSASALVWLRYASLGMKRRRFYKIAGGNDLLPRAFAARLRRQIRYASPVSALAHDETSVRAVCAGEVLNGDYLLCTVPFSVLAEMTVTPPFSTRKRAIIENLRYVSASKVILEMSRRFWSDDRLDGFATTDLPLGEVLDGSYRLPGTAGILLTYTTGRYTRDLCALADKERISRTLVELERVYPGSTGSFSYGTSVCWDAEAWSRGAWAFFRPGEGAVAGTELAEPEGRIYFAGEHTSDLQGWMEGAIASGHRAAAVINGLL